MVYRLRRVDRDSRFKRFSFDLGTELIHMHDRPAYELQITQLAIVQIITVIFKNSYEAYKFALAVKFHINYLTGINPANTALRCITK
jgi:CTP:phosphocholine cytidylyltransferase-like protein